VSQTNSELKARYPELGKGFAYALGAYLIWGSFPLFITMLGFAPVSEVVGWRIIWGFATAAVLITANRGWAEIGRVLRNRNLMLWLALASVLILVNWEVYVIGVLQHQVVQSSLGYFINPLVTILLAVVFLGERLRRVQWVAVGLGAIAVTIRTIDYGQLPWIALSLAASFGFYGLVKSKLSGQISALNSYAIESLLVVPVAAAQIALFAGDEPLAFGRDFWQSAGLVTFGVMTAVPLILFGSAAARLPLSYVGFMQYLTPSLQFVMALVVLGEPMPPVRWIGFAIVWAGLALLIADAARSMRK
jgi:chloramphenicol-sensitive protein RarD